MSGLVPEVMVEDSRWDERALHDIAQRIGLATADHLSMRTEHEFCIMACDDARIAELNAQFRAKPSATNVLSWPTMDLSSPKPGQRPKHPDLPELGDIAIAYDTCAREACEQGKEFSAHATHLLLHGLLHLLGYDHENEPDATLMEAQEIVVLEKLGLPSPY